MANVEQHPGFICTTCIREKIRTPELVCDHEQLQPCSTCIKQYKNADQCILVPYDDAQLRELHNHSAVIAGLEAAEAPGGIPPTSLAYQSGLAELSAQWFEREHAFRAVKAEEPEAAGRVSLIQHINQDPVLEHRELQHLRQTVRERDLALRTLTELRVADEVKIKELTKERDGARRKPRLPGDLMEQIILHLIAGFPSLKGHVPHTCPHLFRPQLLYSRLGKEFVETNLRRNIRRLARDEHMVWVNVLSVSKYWKTRATQFLSAMTWPARFTMTPTASTRAYDYVSGKHPLRAKIEKHKALKKERVKSESKKRKRKKDADADADAETRSSQLRRDSDDMPIPRNIRTPFILRPLHPPNYQEPHRTTYCEIPDDATYVPSVCGGE